MPAVTAATSLPPARSDNHRNVADRPRPSVTELLSAAVGAVPTGADLERLSSLLSARGIKHHRVEEPDPPWLGALMAIGFEPAEKGAYQRHLSSLPLLR